MLSSVVLALLSALIVLTISDNVSHAQPHDTVAPWWFYAVFLLVFLISRSVLLRIVKAFNSQERTPQPPPPRPGASQQGEQSSSDPQHLDSRRSNADPGDWHPDEGSPVELSDSPYPPLRPGNQGANEDALAVLMAKDTVNRRFATAGQLCGYATGLPLFLAIAFGKPPTAWVVGAFLGLPLAVTGMVLSGLSLRSLHASEKKTAKQGLTYSIVAFVGVLGIAIVLLLLSSGALHCC